MMVLLALGAAGAASPPEGQLVGCYLVNGALRARVTDNTSRLCPLGDYAMPGYNGLAALVSERQGRNAFNPVGLNYECGSTVPQMGKQKGVWNAPRVAPMAIEQLDARTVRLTQKGADAAGLNAEIVFELGETWVDQTVTVWPDVNIKIFYALWASYMNLVQNTSLYLRGVLKGEQEARWLEMTSAGHNGGLFFRPCDPAGKAWHEFLTDNPVMRQAIVQTPETVAATERAGFRAGELAAFDNFFFGFVDDYVALWIFRSTDKGTFNAFVSASGRQAVRAPAWDFGIWSGPQKAGERRTYCVRLVYKPFVGVHDVLKEVERFQTPEGK